MHILSFEIVFVLDLVLVFTSNIAIPSFEVPIPRNNSCLLISLHLM